MTDDETPIYKHLRSEKDKAAIEHLDFPATPPSANDVLAAEEADADRRGEREGNVFTAAVYALGLGVVVALVVSFVGWLL